MIFATAQQEKGFHSIAGSPSAKSGEINSPLHYQVNLLQDSCKRIEEENRTLPGKLNVNEEKLLPKTTLEET